MAMFHEFILSVLSNHLLVNQTTTVMIRKKYPPPPISLLTLSTIRTGIKKLFNKFQMDIKCSDLQIRLEQVSSA